MVALFAIIKYICRHNSIEMATKGTIERVTVPTAIQNKTGKISSWLEI